MIDELEWVYMVPNYAFDLDYTGGYKGQLIPLIRAGIEAKKTPVHKGITKKRPPKTGAPTSAPSHESPYIRIQPEGGRKRSGSFTRHPLSGQKVNELLQPEPMLPKQYLKRTKSTESIPKFTLTQLSAFRKKKKSPSGYFKVKSETERERQKRKRAEMVRRKRAEAQYNF